MMTQDHTLEDEKVLIDFSEYSRRILAAYYKNMEANDQEFIEPAAKIAGADSEIATNMAIKADSNTNVANYNNMISKEL